VFQILKFSISECEILPSTGAAVEAAVRGSREGEA
jgi:hypothetical protein